MSVPRYVDVYDVRKAYVLPYITFDKVEEVPLAQIYESIIDGEFSRKTDYKLTSYNQPVCQVNYKNDEQRFVRWKNESI